MEVLTPVVTPKEGGGGGGGKKKNRRKKGPAVAAEPMALPARIKVNISKSFEELNGHCGFVSLSYCRFWPLT